MNRDLDPTPDPAGAPGAGGCALITPFGGGELVDLVVHDPDERASLLERAQNLPVVPLSLRAQYDLEMMAVGAFSPLDRFMGHDEYESVLYEMRLEGGELFPIPLAVPCREEVLRGHPREIALSDEQGVILALLEVDEVYPADILREMRAVLGGRDSAHPLVIEAKNWPSHYLAGRPRVFDLPRHRLHGPLCLTPAAGARAPHGDGQLHRGGVPDAQPHAPHPRGAHQARAARRSAARCSSTRPSA